MDFGTAHAWCSNSQAHVTKVNVFFTGILITPTHASVSLLLIPISFIFFFPMHKFIDFVLSFLLFVINNL